MNDQIDQNLFKYVWKHSRRQHIWILVIVALSMPTYFLAFDIPKLIELYRQDRLKLDELITGRYKLEEINEAIASVNRGEALRNVIVFD